MKNWYKKYNMYSKEKKHLQAELAATQRAIDSAHSMFEQVIDPTLIDCYIYELNAAQLRYQFLLRKFKKLELAR